MTDKKEEEIPDRSKLPEPVLPACPECGKDPFKCKCHTWEDLKK